MGKKRDDDGDDDDLLESLNEYIKNEKRQYKRDTKALRATQQKPVNGWPDKR